MKASVRLVRVPNSDERVNLDVSRTLPFAGLSSERPMNGHGTELGR